MNPWTFATFLAAFAGLAFAPSASAQGLPGCPDDDEVLVSTVPDYVRVGASLAFTVERVEEGVSEFDVVYPSAAGEQREHFVYLPDQDEIRVIRAALPAPGTFDLTVTWQQNAGQPDACAGSDHYKAIPVVKRTARVGRPRTARLSGRYRATYTHGQPTRWSLRPSCDVFGCATALRSSGGFRGILRPQPDGTYLYEERTKIAACDLRYGDGSTRTYGIYAYTRVTLRVKTRRARDRVALTATGKRTYYEAAPSDELDLCDVPERRETTRLTLRRLSP